jgi:hypothetical protein
MTSRLIEVAHGLTFDVDRLKGLDPQKKEIYTGMHKAFQYPAVRRMFVAIAEENGIFGRRFVSGYVEDYIRLMKKK